MKNYLLKARQERKAGNLQKAVKYYSKVMQDRHSSPEQQDISLYMLAFTYVLMAHQLRNESSPLGADLRLPPVDAYHKAHDCLARLSHTFDPHSMGLPSLTAYERKEISEAVQ